MQAAEMLCGTRVYHFVFLISLAIGYVHSFPLQILPSIPGYIPVYIRHGDEPLEDINPALAEAFHEKPSSPKATNLANVNGPTDISLEVEEPSKTNIEAIRVRQAETDFSDDDENAKEVKKASEAETLKPKPIMEPVVIKLTEEEKDSLSKIMVQVKEEAKKLNDLHGPDEEPFKLSLEASNQKDNVLTGNQNEDQPDFPQIKEDSTSDSALTGDKLIVKEQSLPNVLSNVQKPEMLHPTETERTENQSLEEKSK